MIKRHGAAVVLGEIMNYCSCLLFGTGTFTTLHTKRGQSAEWRKLFFSLIISLIWRRTFADIVTRRKRTWKRRIGYSIHFLWSRCMYWYDHTQQLKKKKHLYKLKLLHSNIKINSALLSDRSTDSATHNISNRNNTTKSSSSLSITSHTTLTFLSSYYPTSNSDRNHIHLSMILQYHMLQTRDSYPTHPDEEVCWHPSATVPNCYMMMKMLLLLLILQ